MAGLDGIINKIHPGDAMDKNLYDFTPLEEAKEIPTVAGSLEEALNALDNDREFLTPVAVYSLMMLLDAYLELLRTDVQRVRMAPHPLEFECITVRNAQ